jgi:hypothetical protein
METIQDKADALRQEAKLSLNRLLKIPEGYSSGLVESFVDCIIRAVVLEIEKEQIDKSWR